VEFRILGPLEVIEGERNVALGGSRQRALLALLLLSPNQVVSSDRLVDDIWAGRAPEGAIHTLRVYMSRLRKALGTGGGEAVLVSRAPGYLARVGPEQLDATRFDALVVKGREQAARGDHDEAAATFAEALGLWRGPALADVADHFSFARVEASRLEEARLATLEERIEADLACGRQRDVLPELEALTRTYPLRERLWAHRMVALYRAGRQAEALRAYQEVRSLLGEELGIEPNTALSRLETAILRHDPELEPITQPRPATPLPLPVLLTDMGKIFVGRDADLNRLGQLWEEATTGDIRVTLLAGEPGVGKTRLAGELATQVHAKGATVLAGRCDEDLGVPYQPFVEALHHVVDHTPREVLSGCLGRYGGELTRLVPELVELVPGLASPLRSDPETERYRLFDAVAGWLASMSADRPVLLLLDDLQWAAKPTLLLLRHVARAAEPKRLLILGLYRDTELGRDHPLVEVLADLRRQGDSNRISLVGLDPSGVAAFMEEAAGHALDTDDLALARAIHDGTEGNPFFVREVLRHLVETGAVQRQEGRWGARPLIEELGIPEGVREVVGRRLSRLSGEANRVLRVASVVGLEFDLAVLRAATDGVEEESLLLAVEEATEARLVIEASGVAPRYRFSHALVRDTLYDSLSPARRMTLHRRVAGGLEAVYAGRLDDHLPALAHHYARATDPTEDTTRAVDYAARAGDRAFTQLAHDEAVVYYRQALELLRTAGDAPVEARRFELLIVFGEAQRCAGDPAHRETLLQAGSLAIQLGDAEGAARAALANKRGFFSHFGAVDLERVEALHAALDAVGASDTPLRARLLASLASESYFASDTLRHEYGRQALRIARRLGDPATLAEVLVAVWFATWDPTASSKRAELADELARLATESGDPVLEFDAGFALFHTASQQGDMERADAGLARCRSVAEQLGQPVLRWRSALMCTRRALAAGRLDEAERLASDAFRLGESAGQPDSATYLHAVLGLVRMLQDRFEEAAPLLQPFAHLATFRTVLGWCYAESGCPDEARAIVADVRAGGFAGIPRHHQWLIVLSMLSRASVRLGDTEAAAELYPLLLPHHSEIVGGHTTWIGPVAHDLGLLATALSRPDDAGVHFAEAAEIQVRIGARAVLVHTQLAWAQMLSDRGRPADAERARELLGQALATARELGLANVERRIVALL
jgi:DNA-binding SARP family transcriptional activator